jgi:GT2 family glycosyltransferase
MVELSIVVPTCNRADLLRRCLTGIAAATQCSHEVIVVDGASTDHTPQVLEALQAEWGERLRVVREERREGFVRAANKGFAAAGGKYLTWINDDARPLEGAFDLAIGQLQQSGADVGLVALFHRWDHPRNIAYELRRQRELYRLCHVRGTLYANFPMGLRSTYERLGYFDEGYYVCAADPDLSLKCWEAGLRVEPAWGAVIEHEEHQDDRRAADGARGKIDNERLFQKWALPPRNPDRNDFDPARPCTLTQRSIRMAA